MKMVFADIGSFFPENITSCTDSIHYKDIPWEIGQTGFFLGHHALVYVEDAKKKRKTERGGERKSPRSKTGHPIVVSDMSLNFIN